MEVLRPICPSESRPDVMEFHHIHEHLNLDVMGLIHIGTVAEIIESLVEYCKTRDLTFSACKYLKTNAERDTRCGAGRGGKKRDGRWKGYVKLSPENWPYAKLPITGEEEETTWEYPKSPGRNFINQ